MERVFTYIRQIFIEDINLTLLGTATLVTVFCWTIGIFFWGIDLLLLPLMFGLFILMLSGPIIIVIYLIRKNQAEQKIKYLGFLKSCAFGTYLGFVLLKPVDTWDERQRQRSGLIISATLENYKRIKGSYPTDLTVIKGELSVLPSTYTWDKFSYHVTDHSYDLDIPIPIMDRWHWDKEKKTFVYSDF